MEWGELRLVRRWIATVRRGEIMAVLESRELADSTAALLAARERLNLAQSNFVREEQVWLKKISPEQAVAFSLLYLFMSYWLIALIGAAVYFRYPVKIPEEMN
jgi:hypothetical protein